MRRGWVITNGVLAAGAAAVVALSITSVGNPTQAAAATQQTTTVGRGAVTATVSASGNASAASSVSVSFQGSGGIVTQIFVKVNQRVKAGSGPGQGGRHAQRSRRWQPRGPTSHPPRPNW